MRKLRAYFISILVMSLTVLSIDGQSLSPMQSSCRFAIPVGVEVDCYRLSVPENRQDEDSGTISLSIAILRHPAGNPEPDPIIFLQGGPGGSTLPRLNGAFNNRFEPLFASNRDIIVFDQRGTGTSSPNLNCTSHNTLETNLLDFELNGQVFSRAEIENRLAQALVNCGNALSNRYDLGGYTTAQNAADVEAIRQAFGYEQINLWGISYGTKLALTIMRDYPDSVRSAVLDSVYPLEANVYTELPHNFYRALSVLFESCAIDEDCNRIYPNLETVLFDTVDSLNAQPIRFDAPNPYSNQTFDNLYFDGTVMLQTVFRLLYASELLPRLPELIYNASEGDFDAWIVLVGWLTAQRGSISTGMNYAVQCQEEFPFTNIGDITSAWDNYPPLTSYTETIRNVGELTPICNAFARGTVSDSENMPVQSDIPTLLFAGQYDPVTPPQWAAQVHENLTDSHFIELPNRGHGASGTKGCTQSILIEFLLTNDTQRLDTQCLQSLTMTFSGTQRGDFIVPNSASLFGTHTKN